MFSKNARRCGHVLRRSRKVEKNRKQQEAGSND